jgi:hypothetical protein
MDLFFGSPFSSCEDRNGKASNIWLKIKRQTLFFSRTCFCKHRITNLRQGWTYCQVYWENNLNVGKIFSKCFASNTKNFFQSNFGILSGEGV